MGMWYARYSISLSSVSSSAFALKPNDDGWILMDGSCLYINSFH